MCSRRDVNERKVAKALIETRFVTASRLVFGGREQANSLIDRGVARAGCINAIEPAKEYPSEAEQAAEGLGTSGEVGEQCSSGAKAHASCVGSFAGVESPASL